MTCTHQSTTSSAPRFEPLPGANLQICTGSAVHLPK
jgi:hypothetical protein